MSKKKYRAKTEVSVVVMLANGKSKRVAFTPMTMGGSVFYTSEKDIQDGLERHYKYGKLFTLEEEIAEPLVRKAARTAPKARKSPSPADATLAAPLSEHPTVTADAGEEIADPVEEAIENGTQEITGHDTGEAIEEAEEVIEESEEEGLKTMVFPDPSSAKEYLCSTYEIPRTKMKSQKAIEEAALSFGIRISYE